MTVYHKNLSHRWHLMSFAEQMANVGSEVYRAISWQQKNNTGYSRLAFERALELLDFTTERIRNFYRLKELRRLREVLVDYFAGNNIYGSTPASLNNYFYCFNYAAALSRKDKT
ncbi:MAG: hypothetical protein FJW68_03075 [Actinobacteria bacterium]|nr:hypothetical protein [Actinomycetota bacterium]